MRDGKETIQPWSMASKISFGIWAVVLVGGYLYGGLEYAAGAVFFLVIWGVVGAVATYDGPSSDY